jgi:hypothetical protein
MALVAGAWFMSMSVLDSGNDVSIQSRRLQATDAASAAAAAAAYVAAFKTVSDAKVVDYTWGQKYIENALTGFDDATVRNSIQAVMTASILDQPLKKATVSIPAPKIELFTAITGEGSDIVDTSAGGLAQTFLEEFWDGGSVYISDGEKLDPITNLKGVRVSKYRRLA